MGVLEVTHSLLEKARALSFQSFVQVDQIVKIRLPYLGISVLFLLPFYRDYLSR
jgi:hypothetical protein